MPHHGRGVGVPMIALPPRDEFAAPQLAGLDEVLPCHLERRLDGLGTARDENHAVEPRGRPPAQQRRQALGRLGREKAVWA